MTLSYLLIVTVASPSVGLVMAKLSPGFLPAG
jgi:hypothetical protein